MPRKDMRATDGVARARRHATHVTRVKILTPVWFGRAARIGDNAHPMADDADDASGTVLLVEDDFDLRDALVPILEYDGHRVVSAANGKEALDRLHAMPAAPSLILLDLMMPVMGGEEFRAEQLR